MAGEGDQVEGQEEDTTEAPQEGQEQQKPNPGTNDALDTEKAPEGQEKAEEADWRVAAANGDEKLFKQLKRFASPASFARAFADTKVQLSKATANAGKLPDNATDEQKAEWRKVQDIPDAPDGYDTSLKGVEWSDTDKAVIGSFGARAMEANMSRGQVKAALQWYADEQAAQAQERAVTADKIKRETERALRLEYGNDYDRNVNIMSEFGTSQLGNDAWTALIQAELPDGSKLGANASFIKLIVDAAMDRADGLPFIEGGGVAGGQSDADFIAAHQKLAAKAMGNNAEAREAKAKIDAPEYRKSLEAAYERRDRRENDKRRAA